MNSRKYENGYYIEGNTARQLATEPVRQERPKKQKEKQRNPQISRNSRRARAFDLKYMMALTMATVFLFVACVNMLTLQADIAEQRRKIANLESSLTVLSNTNDEKDKRLKSSVDLTKVYDVATNELGMIYPKNGQVISYEASNPDYVKQFKDVPTE